MSVVERWDRERIPEYTRPRSVIDTLGVDTILQTIRQTDLTSRDAERVVAALKARDLVEYAVMRGGPGAEGSSSFFNFLELWRKSPYPREAPPPSTHRPPPLLRPDNQRPYVLEAFL